MNKIFAALLVLLRAGLWEKNPDGLDLFPLTADEWEEVYLEARRQTVTGLIYRGIRFLPEEMLPPQRIMLRWMVNIDRIERHNVAMNQCVVELTGLLAEKGIQAVVQKGQGVAAMYEEPLLRECGDIDLYFPKKEDREKAESWLQEQGKTLERKPDGSTAYSWRQVEVEHHPDLFDLQSPKVQGFLKDLIAGQGFGYQTIGDKGLICVPVDELNLLLLNVHILKHAMGKGIGLRQFSDMARAYYVQGKRVDGKELRYIYKKTGIAHWSRLLHTFLTSVLGMSAECLPYQEETDEPVEVLMEIVQRGGNFGKYEVHRKVQEQSLMRRKWNTCRAFWQNAGFSLKYAPAEAIHTFGQLAIGQFK